MAASLPLSTGPLTTSPLTVFHIPCNVSFVGMATGIDHCQARISISTPLSTASSMQFVPWSAAEPNISQNVFTHPVYDLPPPIRLNKSVLAELDSAFNALDGQLSASVTDTSDSIDHRQTESSMGITEYIAGFALGLSLISCIPLTLLLLHFRRRGTANGKRCTRCNYPRGALCQPTSSTDRTSADDAQDGFYPETLLGTPKEEHTP